MCPSARSLYDTNIGDKGAASFAEALKINTTLQELECAATRFGTVLAPANSAAAPLYSQPSEQ